MDLSRNARANAAISPGVSPFCASAVRKSALGCRNFFVDQLFNCLTHLLVPERLRGGQLGNELLNHGAILKHNARGSNRKCVDRLGNFRNLWVANASQQGQFVGN